MAEQGQDPYYGGSHLVEASVLTAELMAEHDRKQAETCNTEVPGPVGDPEWPKEYLIQPAEDTKKKFGFEHSSI